MLERRGDTMMLLAADGVIWPVALAVAAWLRSELDIARIGIVELATVVPAAIAGQWAIGGLSGLYRRRHRIGSSEESLHLAAVVLSCGLLLFGVTLMTAAGTLPRSVPLIAAPLALLATSAVRMAVRRHRERRARRSRSDARRTIILGAGRHGLHLADALLADPSSGYLPVAFVDDDPGKRHLRSGGLAVRGTSADLADVAARARATLVVVAVPDIPEELLHKVCRTAGAAGVTVRVMPRLDEVLRPRARPRGVGDLDVAGLLGRRQVDLRPPGLDGRLDGRRVLVTGAGGSIGAELCRQIHRSRPEALFMVDHDESALHAVRLSIYGSAMLDSPDVVLADIRDPDAIRRVFADCRPDVVFHAAALKHLPMLERFPLEAWKTNVLGTLNVLDAAGIAGVGTFVNISTDKAARPTSVLGRSKRIGERLVANAAANAPGTFLSVRFGNVLGSRGSVLTTFAEQLACGGPVTVTHPDVTRFFMTIAEAVHLVIQAAAIGRSGETLVLDMGAPVRIVELARRLMRQVGSPTPIVYTGLRAGEKLHEELFGEDEPGELSPHPAIARLAVPPLDPTRLADAVLASGELAAMVECSASVASRPKASRQEVIA